ncbi:MAG: hypothetical protein ABR497_03860 [Kiritimatiellia bacterium]|nr:hypothetical protein [Lentisphaerota bacterium]
MKPLAHVAVSLAAGAGLGWALKSMTAALACLTAGVLIDLDHIPDYFWNFRRRPDAGHFFHVFKHDVLDRVIVVLHSWELMLLLLLGVWWTGWRPLGLGLLCGALLHLSLDQLFNRHSPLAYSLIYRLRRGFAGRYFYGRREYRERLRQSRRADHRSGTGVDI